MQQIIGAQLSDEHGGADGGNKRPVADVLQQEAHPSAGIALVVGGGAVGKGAVKENGVVRNHDLGLVQLVVAAVANHLVEHSRGAVAAVVIAAALDVRVTGALHRLGLVAPAAVVVVAVRVGVGVEVCPVRPRQKRVESQSSQTGAEEEGRDAGWGAAAGAVRLSRAASVV